MTDTRQMVTVTYLQMLDPAALRPKPSPPGFEVAMVDPPEPGVNRRLYEKAGEPWQWTERLTWSSQQWTQYAEHPALHTWVASLAGQEAGYFELESQAEGNVQIMYFGMVPEFIGRGLGGAMLTAAIQSAWAIPGARRVWLHTCTKDHASALPNYRKRGFEVYKTETE